MEQPLCPLPPLWRRLLPSLLAYGLLFVGTWAWSYGHPVFLNPDATVVEDMYRDIVLGQGHLGDWFCPRPRYFIDIFVYFFVRFLGGDVHNGLALYSAVQSCFVVSGAHYALRAACPPRLWLPFLLAAVHLLSLHGDATIWAWMMGTTAHIMTFATALWGMGLFLRLQQGRKVGKAFFLFTALATLCDFMFVMWAILPAGAVLGLRFLCERGERRALIARGLGIGAAVLVGKAADVLTRSFPAAALGSFKPQNIPEYLGGLAADCLKLVAETPALSVSWALGAVSLLFTLWYAARQRRQVYVSLCLLALLCVLFSTLIMAAYSMAYTYYYLAFFQIPLLFGLPLAAAFLLGRFAACGSAPFLGRPALHGVFASCCALLLVGTALFAVKERREPLYPPMAQCLDRFALSHQAESFLLSFWNSGARLFSQKTMIAPQNVFPTLLPDRINSNAQTQSPRASGLLLSPEPTWAAIDPELVRRLNGEPDEIFACSEAKGTEIWLYNKGARAMQPADMLFDAARLVPEQAKDDVVLWQGRHVFANGLTLTRLTAALRWEERWCVLEFENAPQAVTGTPIEVSFIGNKSPKHKRKAVARLAAAPDSAFSPFLRMFLHKRGWNEAKNPLHPLPGGGTAVFFTLPSRHSTEWPFFEVNVNKERFALR